MTTIAPPRGARSGFADRVRSAIVGLDWVLLLAVAAITGFSLYVIGRSTEGDIEGDPRFYLDRQILFVAVGVVALVVSVRFNLDYVERSEPVLRRSGVGDVVSNLSAIEDWRLAGRERGEPVDGVAVTFARTAATSILHRRDGIDDEAFLVALAEALVLSGLAMATAGSSRPCSGSEHEVLHAIDHLFPETARHGELAGAACLFTSFLRGDDVAVAAIDDCLRRHRLPRTPADLGLSSEQFTEAVLHAPGTRPDRFTILEHLDLDAGAVAERVRAEVDAVDR